MEKQVTSNITQLSLVENLEKWLGRQVLASFYLIPSSILVMKELHLGWTGATLGPFCFWVSWNISWIFTRRNICLSSGSLVIGSQRFIKKWCAVSHSSRPLAIEWISSSFFLSISTFDSSKGRFPLLGLVLRWADNRYVSDGAGVYIELSAEEHSATKSSSLLEQMSFSGSADSRSSCLD